MAKISPLAYVHPEAKLADDVVIDAFVYIDADVTIGAGSHIMSHSSVIGGTTIGEHTDIYDGCVIGADPQDFRWKGERGRCVIGSKTKIYQHTIINRSIREGGKTSVGSGSYVMAQTHIGHDSSVGDHCVLGNGVKVAGDCDIADCTILSSGVIVHEKCSIGEWSLIKGGCRVTGNVPPFAIMAHNPISYYGVNAYVMRRGKRTEDRIDDIAKCYRHIYQCSTSLENAIRRIKEDVSASPERDAILNFIAEHDSQIAATRQDILEY